MAIVLRSEKGSELTHEEMDANFEELRNLIPTEKPTSVRKSGASEGDLYIFLFDIGVANFDGVNLGNPIAYVKINGTIDKLARDEYGNYIDDGYGNPTVTQTIINSTFGIFVDDDGYGTRTIRNQYIANLGQEDGSQSAEFHIPAHLMGFFSIEVSVLPTIDFANAEIETGIEIYLD